MKEINPVVYRIEHLDKTLFREIRRLTYKKYSEKKYCLIEENPDAGNPPEFIQYPHLDKTPPTVVVTARYDGHLIGSMSFTEDLGDLPLDEKFLPYLNRFRENLRVIWRFAYVSFSNGVCIDERITGLGILNHAILNVFAPSSRKDSGDNKYLYAIEVNPKHVKFYQIIGFSPLSPEINDDKIGAPGILMIGNENDIYNSWINFKEKFQKKRIIKGHQYKSKNLESAVA